MEQQVLLNNSTIATQLGLSGTPTVNDALGVLGTKGIFGEMVSYTGTGTYGSSNACSATFSHEVEVIIAVNIPIEHSTSGGDEHANISIVTADLTTSYVANKGFFIRLDALADSYAKKSNDGKTVYWYNTESQYNQLNASGTTYYFLGLWGTGI